MKNLTAKGRNEQAERMAERVTQVSNRREKKARSKSPGLSTAGQETGWLGQARAWAAGANDNSSEPYKALGIYSA